MSLQEFSMGRKERYSAEFKDQAVRQVLEHGNTVRDVAKRLGIGENSLYLWTNAARPVKREKPDDELAVAKRQIQKLEADLRRTQEERDILKKAAAYFAKDHG
jgi:transposase